MSVDIENLSIPVQTYCMLHAPVFMESEWVQAVWGSARQDDCRVRGHVGIWIVEREQLQAAAYCTVLRQDSPLCLWAEDGAYWLSSFVCFFIAPHWPRDCYHPGLFSLNGATVDRVDANHPTVYERRPSPWGDAEDVNWNWPDLSSRFLLFVIFQRLTYYFTVQQCKINPMFVLRVIIMWNTGYFSLI